MINSVFISSIFTFLYVFHSSHNTWRKRSCSLQQKLMSYQKFRVLVTVYNNSLGSYYVPPLTTLAGILSISGLFMAIKLAHLKNFIVTVCGILTFVSCGSILAIITTLCGCVHSNCQKLVIHVNNFGYKGSLERRVLRSFKVEAVKSGNFYEIRKVTSLTVLGMVSNVAGSALLSVSL